MISNERPSPLGDKPADVLFSRKLQVERKTFILELKENPRGRFLTITENAGRNREMIVVPTVGLDEFQRIFGKMVKTAGDTPTPQGGEEPDGNR